MGACKSRILIKLKQEELAELTQKTHFSSSEIKGLYRRYWKYCSPDGSLNRDQFCLIFSGAPTRGDSIIDHIFRTTDKDDSHSIDFTEFVLTVSVILRGTEVQKMMWLFHLFDENDDGTIAIEEIEHVLDCCDKKVDPADIRELFTQMDKDNDGKVDINEFTAGCRKNNLLLKNMGIS